MPLELISDRGSPSACPRAKSGSGIEEAAMSVRAVPFLFDFADHGSECTDATLSVFDEACEHQFAGMGFGKPRF
jgi:hypothetical protein